MSNEKSINGESRTDSCQNTVCDWLYEEQIHSGVDYSQLDIARKYDQRHMIFRDFDAEFDRIKGRLNLKKRSTVLDIGCGTGAFVIPAAKFCHKVIAADVSEVMLTLLKEKIDREHLENVEIHQGGFLTYQHQSKPVDAIISSLALHHLPDFWKVVALRRLHEMLKDNGLFYLFDVVFTFSPENWQSGIESVLSEMSGFASQEGRLHIKREYSTFDWMLESMLDRTGFFIEHIYDDLSFCRAYVCRKI